MPNLCQMKGCRLFTIFFGNQSIRAFKSVLAVCVVILQSRVEFHSKNGDELELKLGGLAEGLHARAMDKIYRILHERVKKRQFVY
jgi:hypothetical protein